MLSRIKKTPKIIFEDQSEMNVETGAEDAASVTNLKVRVIEKVQQQEKTLRLIGEGNQSTDIPLKAVSASVMLRDKNDLPEYFH
jgi:hypothetical protein